MCADSLVDERLYNRAALNPDEIEEYRVKNAHVTRRILFLLTAGLIGASSGLLSAHTGFDASSVVYAQTGCTKGAKYPSVQLDGLRM